jgi:nitric oxide reductase subunit C
MHGTPGTASTVTPCSAKVRTTPDLTEITSLRGSAYLAQFLQDPAKFYSEAQDRRLMTNPQLSQVEIGNVIAFLSWIDGIDNSDWPPRPILVSGSAMGSTLGTRPAGASSNDPVELGEALFRTSPPACFACHSTAADVQLAGPSLAGIAARAQATLESPDYTGAATVAEGYLRESIVQPSAHVVPGERFSAGGRSFMPDNFEQLLRPEQVAQLVAYLLTLR